MSAKTNVVKTAEKSEVKAILSQEGSKSAKIRALAALEVPRAEIALLLDIRYQHVRNVLETKLTGKQQPEEKKD